MSATPFLLYTQSINNLPQMVWQSSFERLKNCQTILGDLEIKDSIVHKKKSCSQLLSLLIFVSFNILIVNSWCKLVFCMVCIYIRFYYVKVTENKGKTANCVKLIPP